MLVPAKPTVPVSAPAYPGRSQLDWVEVLHSSPNAVGAIQPRLRIPQLSQTKTSCLREPSVYVVAGSLPSVVSVSANAGGIRWAPKDLKDAGRT